jgi:hypothetical protein
VTALKVKHVNSHFPATPRGGGRGIDGEWGRVCKDAFADDG